LCGVIIFALLNVVFVQILLILFAGACLIGWLGHIMMVISWGVSDNNEMELIWGPWWGAFWAKIHVDLYVGFCTGF